MGSVPPPVAVADVVELAEAVGPGHVVEAEAEAQVDGGPGVGFPALPNVGPRQEDDDLDGDEDSPRDEDAGQVDAETLRTARVFAEEGRGGVVVALLPVEPELVRDLDRLDEEEVVAGGRRRRVASSAASPTEGVDRAELARGVLLVALHRLAGRHARRHQRPELHHFR